MSRSRTTPRRRRDGAGGLHQLPWQLVENPMPPVEVLRPDQVERIHDASLTILEEIGVDFLHDEAIEILRLYDEAASEKLPRTHVVFGKWEQPLDVKPGEKVIFMGDCAAYRGPLGSGTVDVHSEYRDRSSMSPLQAQHDDIFVKMVSVKRKLWAPVANRSCASVVVRSASQSRCWRWSSSASCPTRTSI